MTKILPFADASATAVEILLDAAFGSDRHRRTAYLLRQNMPVIDHLSFALFDGSVLVGSIQCWPVAIAATPLILVGPVAVAPDYQNRGHGQQLMRLMLATMYTDEPPMVMIGDPEYYERFGFVAAATGGWTLPGPWDPRRLLLRNPRDIRLPETGLLGPNPNL